MGCWDAVFGRGGGHGGQVEGGEGGGDERQAGHPGWNRAAGGQEIRRALEILPQGEPYADHEADVYCEDQIINGAKLHVFHNSFVVRSEEDFLILEEMSTATFEVGMADRSAPVLGRSNIRNRIIVETLQRAWQTGAYVGRPRAQQYPQSYHRQNTAVRLADRSVFPPSSGAAISPTESSPKHLTAPHQPEP